MGNAVGVNINRTSAGPMPTGEDPGDSVFMVVTAERGLANVAHLITSYAQYRDVFGGENGVIYSATDRRISDGDEVAKKIFAKGPARLYCVRVVNGSAASANVTINDRFDEEEEEEAELSLTVTAKGPGTWANLFNINIADGTRANTFKVTVQNSATGSSPWTTLETFDNVVWSVAGLAAVTEQSKYISLALGTSTNADPRPASGNYNLDGTTSGVDGNSGFTVATHIVGTDSNGVKTGMKVFRDRRLGRGFIIAPGLDYGSTYADVRTEMIAQFDTFYHYPLIGWTPNISAATMLSNAATAPTGPISCYWPNEIVEDEITGALKSVSPVGTVLGAVLGILRKARAGGLGRHFAGKGFEVGRIETQASGQPLVDATVAELLMAKGINPIWDRGFGNQVLGARDWYGATYATWKYNHAAYLWAHIADRTQRALDPEVFATVEDVFFESVESGLYAMLHHMLINGKAFFGTAPARGEVADMTVHAFDVKCNASMMTPTDRANNTPRARIVFNDSISAETIEVDIAKNNFA